MISSAAHSQPKALLGWMESLADSTRLRLLRLLERHELGVAELCDVLQLPQSTVSRHLKILADEAWLRSRPHRTTNLYRMDLGELDPAARRLWTLTREQTDDWAPAPATARCCSSPSPTSRTRRRCWARPRASSARGDGSW